MNPISEKSKYVIISLFLFPRRVALASGDIRREQSVNNRRELCDSLNTSEKQRKLCMLHDDLIQEVALGAKNAYRECGYQFRWRRWNCSTKQNYISSRQSSSDVSLFGKDLVPGLITF